MIGRLACAAVVFLMSFLVASCRHRDVTPSGSQEEGPKQGTLSETDDHRTSVERLLRQGEDLYISEEYESALAAFDRALAINGGCKEAHVGRARVLIERHRMEVAIDALNRALELDPGFCEARHELARVFAMQNDFRKAHKELTKLLAQDRGGFFVFMDRAIVNLHLERHREAIQDLEAAARVDASPSIAYEPHVLLARIYAASQADEVRDGETAVAYATIAYERAPTKTKGVTETVAMAFAEQGNFDLAVTWQKKANAITPDSDSETGRQRLALYESGLPFRGAGSVLVKDFHF